MQKTIVDTPSDDGSTVTRVTTVIYANGDTDVLTRTVTSDVYAGWASTQQGKADMEAELAAPMQATLAVSQSNKAKSQQVSPQVGQQIQA